MKTTTTLHSRNRSQLRRGSVRIALGIAFACFALSSTTQAVAPQTERGYQSLHRTLLKTIYETAKLTASDGSSSVWFGNSVSVWKNEAIIGARYDNNGSAYVFTFDGTNWNEQAKLVAADGTENDYFGSAVAISGNLALVGAEGAGDVAAGAVYVFAFNGTSWIQQAKLTASDSGDSDNFGSSVALSGNVALVGAPWNNDAIGAAYVFVFDGATWNQRAKLVADDGVALDLFGTSVSLSGRRALVGAPEQTGSTIESGAAYIFQFEGTTWVQEAKLTGSDVQDDEGFGIAVSLSGNRALVGVPGKSDVAPSAGAAYIFAFDGSTWSQEAKLLGRGHTADRFGCAVALSGTRAIVGADHYYAIAGTPGEAFVFSLDQSTWRRRANLVGSDQVLDHRDFFGESIALSATTCLVGAHGADNENGESIGAGYVFSLNH